MAEFTITKWKCDRCGVIEDKRPRHNLTRSMVASVDCSVSGGCVQWKELCADCNKWLGEKFKEMGLKL